VSGVLAFRVAPLIEGDLTIDQSTPLARMYFDDEWGRPQTDVDGRAFRWATSPHSVLYAPLSQADYQMCGLYKGARDGQKLTITVNGLQVAEISMTTRWTRQCFTILATALYPGSDSISFESAMFSDDDPSVLGDRAIGRTGVAAPTDIAVTSAGFLAGKFASLTAAGSQVYETKRGLYLMAIDAHGRVAPTVRMFDTFRDESESDRLADFVRTLPTGTIVAGAVCDEASSHLTQAAVDALETVGASFDLRGRFRTSYAFVGVKGAAPGTAVEASDPSFPANVAIGKDVTTSSVSFALGTLQFTQGQK
jgi:Interleukin-like EMT inducer